MREYPVVMVRRRVNEFAHVPDKSKRCPEDFYITVCAQETQENVSYSEHARRP